MAALLRLLVLVCALFAPASAFVAPSTLCRSAVAPAAAVTMGCRQNLKKEKRVRNRINAFRFKKNSARRRCHRPLARAAHAARRSWEAVPRRPLRRRRPTIPSARPKFPLGARRPHPPRLSPLALPPRAQPAGDSSASTRGTRSRKRTRRRTASSSPPSSRTRRRPPPRRRPPRRLRRRRRRPPLKLKFSNTLSGGVPLPRASGRRVA